MSQKKHQTDIVASFFFDGNLTDSPKFSFVIIQHLASYGISYITYWFANVSLLYFPFMPHQALLAPYRLSYFFQCIMLRIVENTASSWQIVIKYREANTWHQIQHNKVPIGGMRYQRVQKKWRSMDLHCYGRRILKIALYANFSHFLNLGICFKNNAKFDQHSTIKDSNSVRGNEISLRYSKINAVDRCLERAKIRPVFDTGSQKRIVA